MEKAELKDRLKTLYKSNKDLEARAQQMQSTTPTTGGGRGTSGGNNDDKENTTTSVGGGGGGGDDAELCKICMDRLIDCVLVECGHMCSCVKCGKLLSECPICRQYVVRVIRVFKS